MQLNRCKTFFNDPPVSDCSVVVACGMCVFVCGMFSMHHHHEIREIRHRLSHSMRNDLELWHHLHGSGASGADRRVP